jgi:hypothetical protein
MNTDKKTRRSLIRVHPWPIRFCRQVSSSPFHEIRRSEPEPGNPQEVEGVLNPAAAGGPEGKLYLFPRLADGSSFTTAERDREAQRYQGIQTAKGMSWREPGRNLRGGFPKFRPYGNIE